MLHEINHANRRIIEAVSGNIAQLGNQSCCDFMLRRNMQILIDLESNLVHKLLIVFDEVIKLLNYTLLSEKLNTL